MFDRLRPTWFFIRSSLWFVPMLMGLAAVLLAILLLTWGKDVLSEADEFWLLYAGNAENARQLLAAQLTGMLSLFSLVVSITMVVLTLAAGQIGPRLIRTFVQDRVTQTVLGLFISDILYLLVVIRSVEGGPDTVGIPHLAISAGTAVTALCLFVLLFYVHRLARSIIYDNVVRQVLAELRETADRLLPAPSERPEPAPPADQDRAWIPLGQDGYIQAMDLDGLVAAARRADARLHLLVRPGQYILGQGRHVAVAPACRHSDELAGAVRAAYVVGAERTPDQDIEFGIRQLVEMALRALSPGINDVFTALAVIDSLSSAMAFVFTRDQEPARLCDADGTLRIVRIVTDHAGMLDAAFDQIRQTARGKATVLARLLAALERLSPTLRTDRQRLALRHQADLILATAVRSIDIAPDLEAIRDRHARLCTALDETRS